MDKTPTTELESTDSTEKKKQQQLAELFAAQQQREDTASQTHDASESSSPDSQQDELPSSPWSVLSGASTPPDTNEHIERDYAFRPIRRLSSENISEDTKKYSQNMDDKQHTEKVAADIVDELVSHAVNKSEHREEVQQKFEKLSGKLIRKYKRENQTVIWRALHIYSHAIEMGNIHLQQKMKERLFTKKRHMLFGKLHNIHHIFSKKKPNVPAIFDILVHIKENHPTLMVEAWSCLSSNWDDPEVIQTLMQYCRQEGENVLYYEIQRDVLFRHSHDFDKLCKFIPELHEPAYVVSIIEKLLYTHDPKDPSKIIMDFDRLSNKDTMNEIITTINNLFFLSDTLESTHSYQSIQYNMAEYLTRVTQQAETNTIPEIKENNQIVLAILAAAGVHPRISTKEYASPLLKAVVSSQFDQWRHLQMFESNLFERFVTETSATTILQENLGPDVEAHIRSLIVRRNQDDTFLKNQYDNPIFYSLKILILLNDMKELQSRNHQLSTTDLDDIFKNVYENYNLVLSPQDKQYYISAYKNGRIDYLFNNQKRIAIELISSLPIDDFTSQDHWQQSIAHLAVHHNDPEVLSCIIQRIQRECQKKQLTKKQTEKNIKMILNLKDKKGDVDSEYFQAENSLESFLSNRSNSNPEILKLLLSHGCFIPTDYNLIMKLLSYIGEYDINRLITESVNINNETLTEYLLINNHFDHIDNILQIIPDAIVTKENIGKSVLITAMQLATLNIDKDQEEEDAFKYFDFIMKYKNDVSEKNFQNGKILTTAIFQCSEISGFDEDEKFERQALFTERVIIPLMRLGEKITSPYGDSTASIAYFLIYELKLPSILTLILNKGLISPDQLIQKTSISEDQLSRDNSHQSTLLHFMLKSKTCLTDNVKLKKIIDSLPSHSIDATDEHGKTLFQVAIESGYPNAACHLAERGALTHYVTSEDDESSESTIATVFNEDSTLAQKLKQFYLKHMSDGNTVAFLNKKNTRGDTLLSHILKISESSLKSLQVLNDILHVIHENQGNHDLKKKYLTVLETKDNEGFDFFTRLCSRIILSNNNEEQKTLENIFTKVVSLKPDYSHTIIHGYTGLHMLAEAGRIDLIQTLLINMNHPSKKILTQKNEEGYSCLEYLLDHDSISPQDIAELSLLLPSLDIYKALINIENKSNFVEAKQNATHAIAILKDMSLKQFEFSQTKSQKFKCGVSTSMHNASEKMHDAADSVKVSMSKATHRMEHAASMAGEKVSEIGSKLRGLMRKKQ